MSQWSISNFRSPVQILMFPWQRVCLMSSTMYLLWFQQYSQYEPNVDMIGGNEKASPLLSTQGPAAFHYGPCCTIQSYWNHFVTDKSDKMHQNVYQVVQHLSIRTHWRSHSSTFTVIYRCRINVAFIAFRYIFYVGGITQTYTYRFLKTNEKVRNVCTTPVCIFFDLQSKKQFPDVLFLSV